MPRPNQRVISLPKDLVDDVEKFIREHPAEGYASIAEYVKNALREKLDREVGGRVNVSLPSRSMEAWEAAIRKHSEWGYNSVEDLLLDAVAELGMAFAKGRVSGGFTVIPNPEIAELGSAIRDARAKAKEAVRRRKREKA